MAPYVIMAVMHLLYAYGLSMVFKLYKLKRWKAFIPFYNTYNYFQLAGKSRLFIVNTISFVLIMGNTFMVYGEYLVLMYGDFVQKQVKKIMFGFAAAAFLAYIINTLTNYMVNKKNSSTLNLNEDDIISMSFLPAVFIPVVMRKKMKNRKTASKIKTNSRFTGLG